MLAFGESNRWYVGSRNQEVQHTALKGRSGKYLGEKFGGLAQGVAAGFKAHGAIFGDVDFEDGVAFGEDAIPFGEGQADGLALCMTVGVNGVADEVGRCFG